MVVTRKKSPENERTTRDLPQKQELKPPPSMQRPPRPYLIPVVIVSLTLLALVGVFRFIGQRWQFSWDDHSAKEPQTVSKGEGKAKVAEEPEEITQDPTADFKGLGSTRGWMADFIANWMQYVADLKNRGAIPNEALLTFHDQAAYDKFLADAAAAGLKIKGQDGKNLTLRVGYEDAADLRKYLADHPESGANVAVNYFVSAPEVPTAAERATSGNVPFGDSALAFIGAGKNANGGRGVKVAILDSAVSAESVFGQRLVSQQLAADADADLSHGTAVASIAGGANGVAPASTILSMAVVGADGMSDSFTLAQGIIAAADQGARVLNISLGSYGDSEYLAQAVAYAQGLGAVVVASSGNDGYTNSTYPARYSGVIAVGAIDAYGQLVGFSNASQNYGLTAPGLEVTASLPGEQQEAFTGTSAAAPFVTGAIASVMSAYPGMSAQDAANLLITYANDGGAAGVDADYGYGILNVQRVLNRSTPNLTDLAVTANYFDAKATGGPAVQYVVQNQGTTVGANWQLETNTGGASQTWSLPLLQPNGVTYVTVPVNAADLASGVRLQSILKAPTGVADFNLQNNGRGTLVQLQ